MAQLRQIDIEKKYANEQVSYIPDYESKNIEQLLETMSKEKNILATRDYFFSVLQLYFDGIVGFYGPIRLGMARLQGKDNKAIETLNSLMQYGKAFVSSFYNAEPTTEPIQMSLDLSDEILTYASRGNARERGASGYFDGVYWFGRELEDQFQREHPEVIVPVAAGGFEPGLLASYVLDCDNVFPIRSTRTGGLIDLYATYPIVQSSEFDGLMRGSKVLVVEDSIFSGDRILEVMKLIKKKEPRSIYGISITTQPFFDFYRREDIKPIRGYLFEYLQ
jgi:hypothetical protein